MHRHAHTPQNEDNQRARKNRGNASYDLVNQQYKQTQRGRELQKSDEARAAVWPRALSRGTARASVWICWSLADGWVDGIVEVSA